MCVEEKQWTILRITNFDMDHLVWSQQNHDLMVFKVLSICQGGRMMEGFPGGANGKEPACQCRRYKRPGFALGLGKFPGGRSGNSLQYSCLAYPLDREAWWATVHRVPKSQTQLKWFSTHAYTHRMVKLLWKFDLLSIMLGDDSE